MVIVVLLFDIELLELLKLLNGCFRFVSVEKIVVLKEDGVFIRELIMVEVEENSEDNGLM